MTQKGHRVISGRRDLLYDPKGHGDLCGCTLTYFITPKGHGVIRGRRDLLYDPYGQLDLWPLPLPTLWPQKVTGSLEVAVTYFLTPKVNLTFDLDLDLKVKHLTWKVTTNVQATL